VNIKGHDLVDGGVGPVASLDLALDHGAKMIFAINPVVPIYNDRDKVRLTPVLGSTTAPYLREKGPALVSDQILKIDNQVKFNLGLELARARHPDLDVVAIQPDPRDTLMFVTPSMNLGNRVAVVNHGYENAVAYFRKNFEELKEVFGRLGIRVSLDKFEADKMIKQAEEVTSK
jgi:hypothetical protein